MEESDDGILSDEEVEILDAIWPNCSVADCEYKAYIPDSDRCYFHHTGKAPPPFEEYMKGEPT
jgi:hypothetical protein